MNILKNKGRIDVDASITGINKTPSAIYVPYSLFGPYAQKTISDHEDRDYSGVKSFPIGLITHISPDFISIMEVSQILNIPLNRVIE